MIMVDTQIRQLVKESHLGIEPFEEGCLQPATYDLRIGNLVYSPGESRPDKPIDLAINGGTYRLPPYGSAVLMTYETLSMPRNIVGRFGLKSGFARRGLFASTGPQVDPGFRGKLFISLLNLTPVSHVLKYLDTFLSIEFHTLDQPPEKTYAGPYQGRVDIGPEILQDLVRLEGLNLAQMQAEFTRLAEHIKRWGDLAQRFEEFLAEMSKHTKAIEALAKKVAAAPQPVAPVKAPSARKVSLQRALEEVSKLFQQKGRLFYSQIAETLDLDLGTVLKACAELEKKGIIEEVPVAKTGSKTARE